MEVWSLGARWSFVGNDRRHLGHGSMDAPLTGFAGAAERLGRDIKAPTLLEQGPSEVRAAARAFNHMQEQLRHLIDDRTQFAAAIAHDLGTPITRLRLRADEIENEGQRCKILADLAQM